MIAEVHYRTIPAQGDGLYGMKSDGRAIMIPDKVTPDANVGRLVYSAHSYYFVGARDTKTALTWAAGPRGKRSIPGVCILD
jgi:hypothetical protein